jgi:hypothetical protein
MLELETWWIGDIQIAEFGPLETETTKLDNGDYEVKLKRQVKWMNMDKVPMYQAKVVLPERDKDA